MFGMSRRQIIYAALGIAIAIPVFAFLPPMEMTWRILIAIMVAAPIFACGFIKVFGIPLEKFVFTCMIPTLRNPTRKYKTSNTLYKELDKEIDEEAPKRIKHSRQYKAYE